MVDVTGFNTSDWSTVNVTYASPTNESYTLWTAALDGANLTTPPGGAMSRPRMSDVYEYQVAVSLASYLLPFTIFGGTIGNMLSFCVLLRKRMRFHTVYFYLAVLSVADTLVLYLSAFKTWIRVIDGFELLHVSDGGCKFLLFAFMVSIHMSAWLIVAVTIDRFIAVWFPFQATRFCTIRKAKVITAAMFVVICLYKIHIFWTIHLMEMGPHRYSCAANMNNHFMVKVYPLLKLASYSIIPFTCVLVFNLAIAFKLWRNRVYMSDASETNPKMKSQNKITVMLLTVSFVWLILTAPFTIRSILDQQGGDMDLNDRARMFLSKTVCFILMYVNHSMNFVLYCVTGKKFRSELIAMLCCCCWRYNRRAIRVPLTDAVSSVAPTAHQNSIHNRIYNKRTDSPWSSRNGQNHRQTVPLTSWTET